MSHSKSIVIKCPACGEKFQAEREAEASFVSCPQCDIQVKISGMEEPRHRKSRLLPQISQLPTEKERRQTLQFQDLSRRGDTGRPFPTQRKELQHQDVSGQSISNIPKVDNVPQANVPQDQQLLEAEAAEKARAAAKAQAESKAAARALAEAKRATAKNSQSEAPSVKAPPFSDKKPPHFRKSDPFDEDLAIEGDSQTKDNDDFKDDLSKSPPRPARTNDQAARLSEQDPHPGIKPTLKFDELRITEGKRWRRHKPEVIPNPQWDDADEENSPQQHRRRKKSTKFVWSVSLLTLLVIATAATLFLMKEAARDPATTSAPPEKASPSEYELLVGAFNKAKPRISEFLAATSIDEALPYIRDPQRVALLMAKYYGETGFRSQDVEEIGPLNLCTLSDGYLLVPLSLKNYEPRGMAVELTKNEIDWESWVGYSEMPFAELLTRQPTKPVLLRVFAKQEDYFNYQFTDADAYLSLRLLDVDRDIPIWGYVKVDSETYREFAARMVAGVLTNEQRLTVYGKFPEQTSNPLRDQLEITDLVTFGWVVRKEMSNP